MKYALTVITLGMLLSGCAAPGEGGGEVFKDDAWTPTGSLIPRKSVERDGKRSMVSGDEAARALQNVQPGGMNP